MAEFEIAERERERIGFVIRKRKENEREFFFNLKLEQVVLDFGGIGVTEMPLDVLS